MKARNIILALAVSTVLVLAATSYNSHAEQQKASVAAPSQRIAVVNLRAIFRRNRLNEEFDARLEADRSKAMSEIEAINRKIENLRSEMRTRAVGSSDHLNMMSQVLEQQGLLQARREFFQQSFEARQQRFTEDIYTRLKGIIDDYASKNGIDLVLVKDEIQFPTASPSDLMLALSTRKVLYSAPAMDITDAILEAVNATAGAPK